MTLLVPQQNIALNAIDFMPTDLFHLVTSTLDHPAAKITPPRTIDDDQAKELAWLEQQFTMQSRDDPGAANLPVWTPGNLPWVTISADGQRAISSSQPEILHNDGTLEALVNNESVHAVDVPVQYASFQEDELLSWLQYPLEDPMDRGYCSNIFGDIPNANAQIVKHSFTQIGLEPQETTMSITPASGSRGFAPNPDIQGLSTRNTIFQNNGAMGICSNDACESKNKVAGADAAMAVGAGRAAGLSSQCGAEVFNVVRATIQPSLPKCSNSVISPSANSKSLDFQPPLLSHLSNEGPSQRQNPFIPYNNSPFQALNSMDTAPFFTPPPPPGMISARNFSHFSLPVAQTKANLHMVGAGSGPTNLDRVRQQFGKYGRMELNAMDSSLEESITTVSGLGSYVAQLQVDEAARYVLPPERGQTTASSSCGQESDMGRERISNIINSSMCNSALTASEKGVETLGTADQTATSPSRGSGNSTEKSGKEAATTSKRKFSGGDDSEYQSEDVEEIAMNNKKPPSGAKRSRAAEMHNQSERRRRDRIKDRMKALQDLIPNANKTDKASMLDEAIEYMKLLQSQLQMMSMRTGIGIPPSMMPTMGVQHLQMPAFPNMGLGMGMGMGVGLGMGMGMGLMDVNAATAGHTMVPMPFACRPAVGPACHPAGLQSCTPSLNMADTHDHLQSSSIMDPYSFYLLQQQMQPASVNMNMHRNLELYNAYMQQQRWQQHLQQSQQSQGNNGSNPS